MLMTFPCSYVYVCPLYFHTNERIFLKHGINIMSLQATPPLYFHNSLLYNINIETVHSSEVRATLETLMLVIIGSCDV
jgi:hypothetical protein